MKRFLVLSLLIASFSVVAEKNVFNDAIVEKPNMEPAIPRPEQEKVAASKLKNLEAKQGRKPNVLVLLVDDLGWGDPGVYGGGAAIGAPTPNIDKLANEGLRLTSMYSQPTF